MYYNNLKKYFKNKPNPYFTGVIFLSILFFGFFSLAHGASAKTFYLDGNLSSNCTSGNYSIANRDCSGSDGDVYNNLADVITALAGGDTLYIRAGSYTRTTNNLALGSLHITASGTAPQHTVISAYTGEQPVICTETGRCQYNPAPGDRCWGNSPGTYIGTGVCCGEGGNYTCGSCTGAGGEGGANCYYPNPAIGIVGNYIDVIGFKTYGQAYLSGHDITLQKGDLGGGGPNTSQGQVVMIQNAYNVTVKNNRIHNSCWGQSDGNGAALMGYNFSAIIENNEFYDNWGADIRIKDTSGQLGRDTHIRYNFFRPSVFMANNGVESIGQDVDIDHVYTYQNIFYQKYYGIKLELAAIISTISYNNTFINCASRDVISGGNPVIHLYNNLHYHSASGHRYWDVQSNPLSLLNSDYNLFYSTIGDTFWGHLWVNRGTTLSAWQSYSGKDAGSLESNPNFLNPTGSNPEDFKRSSYTENFIGSSYGVHAGAYETGNETIGVDWTTPADVTPPNAPTGFVVL